MHGRPSTALPSLPRPVPPAARRGDRPRDTPRRSPPPHPASLRPARGAAAPRQSCSGPRRGRAEYAAGPRAGPPFCPRRAVHRPAVPARRRRRRGWSWPARSGRRPSRAQSRRPAGTPPPPRRFAAKFCRCHAQKSQGAPSVRPCRSTVFLYFSDPAPPRQRHPAGCATRQRRSLPRRPASGCSRPD